jgi:hypothetical protein
MFVLCFPDPMVTQSLVSPPEKEAEQSDEF